jgi:outer membrane protein OmpA-like peptidoglycan-associated protein
MKKNLLLSVALALCLVPFVPVHADEEVGTLAYYPIPEADKEANYYQWKKFVEYNVYREPCQGYEQPPAPYEVDLCKIRRFQPHMASVIVPPQDIAPAAGEPTPSSPAVSTIYFDFDKYNLRASEQSKFDALINNIKNDNPSMVTVSGYTDTAGADAYNVSLSQRRAQTITNEMTSHGIHGDIIEQKAYGETNLAVATGDGIPNQENRRAVIEYSR